MRVQLFSRDVRLEHFCRQLIEAAAAHGTELLVGEIIPEQAADVVIWDYEPGTEHHLHAQGATGSWIVLVERRHLPQIQKDDRLRSAHLLLKPVRQAMLRTFLEHALTVQAGPDTPAAAARLLEERDRLFQLLLQANLSIQEHDQHRTNFFARALHDFRAPLTALEGYCGLLVEERLGSLHAEQRDVLRRMQRSVQRVSRLAAALFELSAGPYLERRPDLQALDIDSAVDQALHEVLPLTEEKQLELQVQVLRPADSVVFDPAQLEQVLVNLLENACKFTPRRGRIELRGYPVLWDTDERSRSTSTRVPEGSETANAYRIDVQDSGPGIPEGQLDRIFEEYTSYAGSRDRSSGGLGLAICRMILRQHHGLIWAENRRQGTVFSLVFPCLPEDHARFPATLGQEYRLAALL